MLDKEMVRTLLCQALATPDVDMATCRAWAPCFAAAIYERGVTIAEEGAEAGDALLLLDGRVTRETMGVISATFNGPSHFDAGVILGLQTRRGATIVAASTCVVWRLPAERLSGAPGDGGPPRWPILREAREQRQSLQDNMQAQLRGMESLRCFPSEILALMSQHPDIRTCLPGQAFFEAGDEAEHVFLLLRGQVQGKIFHTQYHTNKHPLENATEIHWKMPLQIHDDF